MEQFERAFEQLGKPRIVTGKQQQPDIHEKMQKLAATLPQTLSNTEKQAIIVAAICIEQDEAIFTLTGREAQALLVKETDTKGLNKD
jgi:hypothetical protein